MLFFSIFRILVHRQTYRRDLYCRKRKTTCRRIILQKKTCKWLRVRKNTFKPPIHFPETKSV